MPKAPDNYDAEIQCLKVKIRHVNEKLPSYEKYKTFEVDTLDDETFEVRVKGLNKQRIIILRASNEIQSMYSSFKSVYDNIIDEYRKAPVTSHVVTTMDDLENEKGITGMLNSLEEMKTVLDSILIEVEETLNLEKELHHNQQQRSIHANSYQEPESRNNKSIDLEALKVPQFDGRIESYIEFISVFEELIDSNDNLSDLHKAVYLKGALLGEAARCIEGIPTTGQNYERLLNKIKSRYENAKVNQHSIMQKLERIPQSTNNSQSCERTFSDIDIIINQLTSTGLNIFQSIDPMWHRSILKKFPERMAEKVLMESHDRSHFTVDDVMNSLKRQIFSKHFLEDAGLNKFEQTKNNDANVNTQYTNYPHSNRISANRNYIGNGSLPVSSDANQRASICLFCPGSNHLTDNCRIPLQSKIDFLKENRACWKCFRTDHGSFDCNSLNCSCGRVHHPTLCRQRVRHPESDHVNRNYTNIRNEAANQRPFQPAIQRSNSNIPSYTAHPMIVEKMDGITTENGVNNLQSYHSTANSNKYIPSSSILMPCTAQVFSPNVGRHVQASVLFDTGSQRTIVSEKFASLMKLNVIANEQYVFSGINGDSDIIEGNIVEVMITDVDKNNVIVNAFTKRTICQGFNAAKLDQHDLNFAHENKFNLSNSHINGEKVHPDIIIGADCYFKLVKNKPGINLPSGLLMFDTICGITLLGFPNSNKKHTQEIANYVSNNCVVRIRSCKAKPTFNQNENVNVSKTIVGTSNKHSVNYIKQIKNKPKHRKIGKVILPTSVISFLRKRTAKLKKYRHPVFLKIGRIRERYIDKPVEQSSSLNPQTRFVDHRWSYLKKSEEGLKDERTLESTVERIHQDSDKFANIEKVKAFKDSNESLNGKYIH